MPARGRAAACAAVADEWMTGAAAHASVADSGSGRPPPGLGRWPLGRGDRHPDADLLDTLREAALARLRAQVPASGAYALLDFPYHANVGDHAIWRGTLAGLTALGFPRPAYTADLWNYSAAALRRRVGRGPILLHGGGNLGDLWPAHQRHRETVLRDHPDNPVIQLPQSIEFRTPAALFGARATFAAHPRFTLMVRDLRSRERARTGLGLEPVLCPDLALCLPRARGVRPTNGRVRLLLRSDLEAAGADLVAELEGDRVDWADWRGPVERLGTRWARRIAQRLAHPQALVHATFEALSRQRLRVGRQLLTGAGPVVTDRLHGHVLCLLHGVAHVLLGDRYGKVEQFHDTWTRPARLCRFVRDPAQIPAALAALRGVDGAG